MSEIAIGIAFLVVVGAVPMYWVISDIAELEKRLRIIEHLVKEIDRKTAGPAVRS